MKLVIAKDYETLSELAAGIVLEKMMKNTRVNLSLTAGNSPKRMYEILIEKMSKLTMDTSTIHYYNFDEVALEGERFGLTMTALKEAFYDPADISSENIHELNADDYLNYDQKIMQDGGLDLILMGIGADGHFCGNMPGYTSFDKEVFNILLNPGDEMYEALKAFTGKTPGKNTVTFGPKTVLAAKQLVLIVNGKGKAEIIKQALEGPVTEDVPASILTTHPNITVILDEEAAELLSN